MSSGLLFGSGREKLPAGFREGQQKLNVNFHFFCNHNKLGLVVKQRKQTKLFIKGRFYFEHYLVAVVLMFC